MDDGQDQRKGKTRNGEPEKVGKFGGEMEQEDKRYLKDGQIYDGNNRPVSPLDDDYRYYKSAQEDLTDPLSDDYCKYYNE